jgi:hypothetical protein
MVTNQALCFAFSPRKKLAPHSTELYTRIACSQGILP